MQTIEAFKCEHTGAVFEDKARAMKSEFKAMMKIAGGSCPSMGSVNPYGIMEWMASTIESGVYPTVIDRLEAALAYYRANQETITPTRHFEAPTTGNVAFPASCAGE